MIKKLIIVLLIINSNAFFAQESDFEKVKKFYDSFDYRNVINLSDALIKEKSLGDSLLIEVYLMRAVSFYSLGKEDSTKENFKDILRIKSNYEIDPLKISPKLISLFNQIKIDFINTSKQETLITDSSKYNLVQREFDYAKIRNSLIRNIFLPGTGQLFGGIKTKGIILSVLSFANLFGAGYFIYDTNKKEKDYLIEIDPSLIQIKYDSYNKSYKIRNVLIISYLVIWIYSQLDLFFFNDNEFYIDNVNNTSNLMMVQPQNIQFNLRVPF